MDWVSFMADLIGILSAFFALFAWRNTRKIRKETNLELERLNQKVYLRLSSKKEYIDLPGGMRREELTRSEVLGWIGMLPMIEEKERERYKLAYTNTAQFFEQMNNIQSGKGDMTFEIPCDDEELAQFATARKTR